MCHAVKTRMTCLHSRCRVSAVIGRATLDTAGIKHKSRVKQIKRLLPNATVMSRSVNALVTYRMTVRSSPSNALVFCRKHS